MQDLCFVVKARRKACSTGKYYIFGITPSEPATGYGYIEVYFLNKVKILSMSSPFPRNRMLATEMHVASGRHYWNSGILMVSGKQHIEASTAISPISPTVGFILLDARTQRPNEDILVKSALEAVAVHFS